MAWPSGHASVNNMLRTWVTLPKTGLLIDTVRVPSGCPLMGQPSSTRPSQSSSRPLHCSGAQTRPAVPAVPPVPAAAAPPPDPARPAPDPAAPAPPVETAPPMPAAPPVGVVPAVPAVPPEPAPAVLPVPADAPPAVPDAPAGAVPALPPRPAEATPAEPPARPPLPAPPDATAPAAPPAAARPPSPYDRPPPPEPATDPTSTPPHAPTNSKARDADRDHQGLRFVTDTLLVEICGDSHRPREMRGDGKRFAAFTGRPTGGSSRPAAPAPHRFPAPGTRTSAEPLPNPESCRCYMRLASEGIGSYMSKAQGVTTVRLDSLAAGVPPPHRRTSSISTTTRTRWRRRSPSSWGAGCRRVTSSRSLPRGSTSQRSSAGWNPKGCPWGRLARRDSSCSWTRTTCWRSSWSTASRTPPASKRPSAS